MVELARPEKGERMADLGSGDGRILIAFAQKGIKTHGFELDPLLINTSQILIKKEKLESQITIEQKNFWHEDLGKFDIITIYPMPDIMENLKKKLLQETKSRTRILLNYYPLPTIKPTAQKHNIYLYHRP